MKQLTSETKAEIYSLSWLSTRDLFRRFPELLSDMRKCRTIWLLRATVAYRLQERAFGIKLTPEMEKYLDIVGGDPSQVVEDKRIILSGTRVVRNWKGKDYVVYVREDGRVEYGDVLFNSLTACARAITGSVCNGRVFFGLDSKKKKEKQEDGRTKA